MKKEEQKIALLVHRIKDNCYEVAKKLLKEYSEQIRADAIEDFAIAWIKDEEQYEGCKDCGRMDNNCCIQCFRDRYLEQLKEQK